ncbi:hypothetical protein K457DRAFT_141704 [Linnemannia elongata AG-77]|uniref:Uncharacterized protein n=1 Tax=Linnemannia elongata AG-77 TaxID=1314771 RepID=A0A197JIH3_9FUNG|nr:hypothetical protein K457DRAFT_141704 [Linnemannia elongata AG-77]
MEGVFQEKRKREGEKGGWVGWKKEDNGRTTTEEKKTKKERRREEEKKGMKGVRKKNGIRREESKNA